MVGGDLNKGDNQLNNEDPLSEEEKQEKREYLKFQISAYFILGLVIFLRIYGPGFLKSEWAKEEADHRRLGGTRIEARKCLKDFKQRVSKLNKMTSNATHLFDNILIYTNDTAIKEAYVRPNLDYREFVDDEEFVYRLRKQIKEMDYYLNHKDSLGFKVVLKEEGRYFDLARFNDQYDSTLFIVASLYHYSEERQQSIKKSLESQNPNRFLGVDKVIENLDDVWYARVFLRDGMLHEQDVVRNFNVLYGPYQGLINTSHKFYFAVYNTQFNEEEFYESVNCFNKQFLDEELVKSCSLRRIKLVSSLFNIPKIE